MKIKYSITLQIVLLALTVVAGYILKGNLSSNVRIAHRVLGGLSGLASLVTVALLVKAKASRLEQVLGLFVVVMTFMAGLAGKSLKTASDYSLAFNMMRIYAVIAIAGSIALLVIDSKAKSRANKKG